jgi:hypothetical protein
MDKRLQEHKARVRRFRRCAQPEVPLYGLEEYFVAIGWLDRERQDDAEAFNAALSKHIWQHVPDRWKEHIAEYEREYFRQQETRFGAKSKTAIASPGSLASAPMGKRKR